MKIKVNFRSVKHIERGLNWAKHVKSLGSGPSRLNGKVHKLELQFENLSRSPFREFLADLMRIKPGLRRLQTWAAKHPDRWSNMVKQFAALSGYAEKTESHNTGLLAIMNMSDSQIEAMLQSHGVPLLEYSGDQLESEGPASLPRGST